MVLIISIEINSHSQFYFTIMKKTIITIVLAGFISLGFTLFESRNTTITEVKAAPVKNMVSLSPDKSNEGSKDRLASWD